jgi:prolyl-tRNA editing enzyme YbaK/EbsC (Cys-tRNA(Pro) deacylase)
MSDAIDRFSSAARQLGFHPGVRRFPEGTKTAAAAAAAIGCEVGQIVKSLVFMVDDRPVLALVSGANRVDETALARLADAHAARRATPEEARAATGFGVGGTPPFGHPARVSAFCDEDLLVYAEVWAAAGTPDSVFAIHPRALLRFSGARVARLAETRSGGPASPTGGLS